MFGKKIALPLSKSNGPQRSVPLKKPTVATPTQHTAREVHTALPSIEFGGPQPVSGLMSRRQGD